MKLLDSIMDKFGWSKKTNSNKKWIDFLNGSGSVYSQFGKDIYASDVVQQAIYSIVTEMKKLNPTHVKMNKGAEQIQYDQIQKVLDNPNPLMTTSDYIEKIVWNLFFNYNAFIYPLWENGQLISLTPLQPSTVEFFQTPSGQVLIHFIFANGYEAELPYENVIHIRYHYSLNDVMGGGMDGQPNDKPLLNTLQLNDDLIKGLARSLKMQSTVQAVITLKSYVDNDKQIQSLKDFEARIKDNDSALLPLITNDLGSTFTPIQKQIQLLDQTTLDFLDKKILRTFGVPVCIVEGDYTTDQYNAFYQKTIKPLIVALNQAHTKAIFTGREAFGYGHSIVFRVEDYMLMTIDQKINFFNQLIDTNSCYKNELRTAFGMSSLAELDGQLAISSNQQNAQNNKEEPINE